mgnify:CR=1 FL=1
MRAGYGYGYGVDKAGVKKYNPINALGAALLGYWDAADASTITLNSDKVTSWKDKIAAYDAVQSTDSLRPIYSATSFGGSPGLTFDGVDDFLHLTPHPFPINAVPSEMWALVSQDALVADGLVRYVVSMGTSSTTHRSIVRAVGGGINYARGAAGSITSTYAAADFAGRSVVRNIIDGTNVQVELNGVVAASAAAVPTTVNTRMRFGAFVNTSASNFFAGQLAAVLVTNRLTDAEAETLRNYLMSRRNV